LEHGDFSQPRITIASGLRKINGAWGADYADYKAPARHRAISKIAASLKLSLRHYVRTEALGLWLDRH
jgi:hypothetical protein